MFHQRIIQKLHWDFPRFLLKILQEFRLKLIHEIFSKAPVENKEFHLGFLQKFFPDFSRSFTWGFFFQKFYLGFLRVFNLEFFHEVSSLELYSGVHLKFLQEFHLGFLQQYHHQTRVHTSMPQGIPPGIPLEVSQEVRSGSAPGIQLGMFLKKCTIGLLFHECSSRTSSRVLPEVLFQ